MLFLTVSGCFVACMQNEPSQVHTWSDFRQKLFIVACFTGKIVRISCQYVPLGFLVSCGHVLGYDGVPNRAPSCPALKQDNIWMWKRVPSLQNLDDIGLHPGVCQLGPVSAPSEPIGLCCLYPRDDCFGNTCLFSSCLLLSPTAKPQQRSWLFFVRSNVLLSGFKTVFVMCSTC